MCACEWPCRCSFWALFWWVFISVDKFYGISYMLCRLRVDTVPMVQCHQRASKFIRWWFDIVFTLNYIERFDLPLFHCFFSVVSQWKTTSMRKILVFDSSCIFCFEQYNFWTKMAKVFRPKGIIHKNTVNQLF